MAYIESMEKELSGEKGCIFCDKKNADDKTAFIVAKGELSYAMLNIFPYNNGHLLFAPYDHLADTDDLSERHLAEIFDMISGFKKKIKEKMKCDGFNLGVNLGRVSGAGVEDHVHFHLVPRWNGDTNFMPILADAKVVPQSLERTWEMLKEKKNQK